MPSPYPQLLGSYSTPRFDYGDSALCEVRGEVVITGLSNSPIPWPVGKRPGGRARALVVFGGLADAVRRESATAICYWWSITPQTVTKWRKEMGVGPMTEGTGRLRVKSAQESPKVARALKKAWAKADDPDRCQKIAEARRGKARPEHVIEAMRKGRAGKPQSAETRAKMSEAHQSRVRPPRVDWTAEQEALLGKVSDEELARRTGRSVAAVISRRMKLKVAPFNAPRQSTASS